MFRQLRPVLMVFLLLTVVTGIVYPLLVTGVAQLAFPEKANGSLIRGEGGYAGSELIGQPFDDPKYFWGRLSATPDFPYNSASSSGSNLGPSNPALVEAVKARVEALAKSGPRESIIHSHRPGHFFGKWSRSPYQPGRCSLSGSQGGARQRPVRRPGSSPGGAVHGAPPVGFSWGAQGECFKAEPGPGSSSGNRG